MLLLKTHYTKIKKKSINLTEKKRKLFNEREAERENAQTSSDEVAHHDFDNYFRKVITVSEDFPVAYLKYDKLIIEGEVYEYDPTVEDIVSVRK